MGRHERNGRVRPGTQITARKLDSITGEAVPIPDPERLVHLQFRRFVGCPMCHLHLRTLGARNAELEAAGVREVVLFHSTAESILARQEEAPPFAVVADPDKRLYKEFGVESSWKAVLHPKAWASELRGLLAKRRKFSLDLHGGPLGLPADFLLAPSGEVLACKYGDYGYDQWSVDEVLGLAGQSRAGGTFSG